MEDLPIDHLQVRNSIKKSAMSNVLRRLNSRVAVVFLDAHVAVPAKDFDPFSIFSIKSVYTAYPPVAAWLFPLAAASRTGAK